MGYNAKSIHRRNINMELTEKELKTLRSPGVNIGKQIEQDDKFRPWDELSNEGKIERLRSIIKIRDMQYNTLSRKIDDIVNTIANHSHFEDGKSATPIRTQDFYNTGEINNCGTMVPAQEKPWF